MTLYLTHCTLRIQPCLAIRCLPYIGSSAPTLLSALKSVYMIQGDEKDLIGGNPSPWVWEKGYFWTNSPCFFVPNDAFYKGSLGGSYAKAWSKKVVVRVILVLWNCRKVLLDRPVPSSVLFHVGIWIMLQHSSSGAKKSEEMQKEEESPVSSSIGICVTQTTCCI